MALYYPDTLKHNNPQLPLLDDNQLGGGCRIVEDKTERNAIPVAKRKINCLVAWTEGSVGQVMQYIGTDLTDANWTNDANWSAIGGATGAETSNAFDWKEVGIFDTKEKAFYNGLALNSTNGSNPFCWYYEGVHKRFYFAYYGSYRDAAGNVKDAGETVTYVAFYDVEKKMTSRDVRIPHGFPQNTDYHNIPTLIVADDGHILVFQESLKPSGGHNSSIEVWRSLSAEKIESSTVPGAHDFTKVAEFGLPVSSDYYLSYPKINKGLADGELFMTIRGNANSGGHKHLLICKSIDNGVTWTNLSDTENDLTLVANCGLGDGLDWYFYSNILLSKRTEGINVVTFINEGYSGTNPASGQAAASRYKVMHYMHSFDGITWGNIEYKLSNGDSGWSKNIVAAGAITRAELDTNFLVFDANAVPDVTMSGVSGGLDNLGNPYILWMYSTRPVVKTGDVKNYLNAFLEYWNGTAWSHLDIFSLLSKINVADSEPKIFYNKNVTISYEPGVIEVVLYRAAGTENIAYTKYSPITSNAKRLIGGVYKIASTQTDHFGAGLVVGDIIAVDSATPICDANNTLVAFDTEVITYRTDNYGASWTLCKKMILPSDSIITTNSNCGGINFNWMDSKEALLFVGIPASKNGTCITHTDFKLFYSKYNPVYPAPTLPTLTTEEITNISGNSAMSGGTITDEGNAIITSKGVCWSTSPNPTLADDYSIDGVGGGSYPSLISGLTTETTYYVRAYAINSVGTAYGDELSFFTQDTPVGYANAYFSGGTTSSTLTAGTDKLVYSTGVMAANTISNLTGAKTQYTGVSDAANYGYFLGGYTMSAVTAASERISYATEVVAASTVSNLSVARRAATGISDGSTYGYACGGYTTAYTAVSDRITFSTAVLAANTVSNLSAARGVSASINAGSTYGYLLGGTNGSGVVTSDRIVFSTGVVSANTTSNMPVATYAPGAVSDYSNYGYYAGGYTTTFSNASYRIEFSTGVVGANTVSNLTVARSYLSGASDGDTYGYFAGGTTGSNVGTTVTDRITFSTGVTSANTSSNLSLAKWGFIAVSGQTA